MATVEKQTQDSVLSRPWVRIVVFLWMIVLPIIFIALPLLNWAIDKTPLTMTTLWATLVWVLAPLVLAIGLRRMSGDSAPETEIYKKAYQAKREDDENVRN